MLLGLVGEGVRSGMRTNRTISILAMSCGLAYWPAEAAACVCMLSPLNCAEIGRSDAVLEATVESIQLGAISERGRFPAGAASLTMFSNDVHIVTMRDVTALRGEAQATVITAADESSCGYGFQAGLRYLIVAERSGDAAGVVLPGPYLKPAAWWSTCGHLRKWPATRACGGRSPCPAGWLVSAVRPSRSPQLR
jgi:hypothetical protein